MKYKLTIGLEVHAELKTATKMFCHCRNDSEERRPNVNVCPICMGHPGTLPVINKQAVKHILKLGVSVGGELADFTEFDRKNYFYPDIPKGYQISQYAFPLVKGGKISGISLERIHLEEDTGRSTHKGNSSLVDFNRAGVPLMELVTKPVIHTKQEAVAFAKELQLLLQTLGAGEANMEKGEMRVEANISLSPDETLGTKVEVKNLNSFRSVERAIEYEVDRQSKLLERGESVIQETRGWDENKEVTFSQRLKEDSHDYRYFPDPDLPKLFISEISEFQKENLERELPELPWQKREKYISTFSLRPHDAELYLRSEILGDFFERIVTLSSDNLSLIQLASNYLTSDVAGLSSSQENMGKLDPASFIALMKMIVSGEVSSRGAKDILKVMFEDGGEPRAIASSHDLLQQSDEKILLEIVQKVISDNPLGVAEYRSGKEAILQYLVGQGMKESRGKANPEVLMQLLKKQLG